MLCKTSIKNPNDNSVYAFFNGFGSDYKFWDNLLPYFSEQNYVLLSENYFSHPEDYKIWHLKEFFEGKKVIGIGHSLGYHKLCALHKQCDFFNLNRIVSLEGFSCYLSHKETMKSFRKFYLDFMMDSYTLYPEVTLYNFMAMCGAPMAAIPSQLDQSLLLDDLELLYSGIEPPDIPHLVLSSFDDWVIPFSVVEDNFQKLADVRIIYTIGAGHLLGMHFPKYVANEIFRFTVQ